MSQENTTELLQELLKSVKTRGFKKTLNLLRVQTDKEIEIENELDKFIVDSVCEAFEIDFKHLLYSKYVRGEIKYAIGLCVLYLYERMSLGEMHKTIFHTKNKTLLSKYRNLVFALNAKNPDEKKIIAIKAELDKKIANFKK